MPGSNPVVESDDPILTPEQVASILRVTRRKVVKQLAYQGTIRSFHVGRELRFWMSDVMAYAHEQTTIAEAKRERVRKRRQAQLDLATEPSRIRQKKVV